MTPPQETITLLTNIGLTKSEATTFSVMLDGVLQVKEIMQRTGMKRPSVYYALGKLEARGLIGRMQVGEYNRWKITDPVRILSVLDEKSNQLDQLKTEAKTFVETLKDRSVATEGAKVTYFEGQKAIESIVFNSLYCKSKEILSIAPQGNFFQQTGSAFALKYVAERQKRNITSRHLWEAPVDAATMRHYYQDTAVVRYVPESMNGKFKTTMFIYDDTVMYIGPQESNYAVVFHSKEHSAMQRAIFETIWDLARKK